MCVTITFSDALLIDWHERGTRHGIRVDEDRLLHSGEPGVQLTWMDGRVDGREIIPRTGKAVEIQALWYNALCVMEHLADKFGDKPGRKRYGQMAARKAELQSVVLERSRRLPL